MIRGYCSSSWKKVASFFSRGLFLENLKLGQAILLLSVFIIVRIIIVAISTNVIDPNLTLYKQGEFFLLRKQEVINFILLLPISLWVYISCWKSAKNFDYYYAFRIFLGLCIVGHLDELFTALKEIF